MSDGSSKKERYEKLSGGSTPGIYHAPPRHDSRRWKRRVDEALMLKNQHRFRTTLDIVVSFSPTVYYFLHVLTYEQEARLLEERKVNSNSVQNQDQYRLLTPPILAQAGSKLGRRPSRHH